MTEELKPSDVLEHAANLINEWGWHRGESVNPATGAMCHLGAIDAASGFTTHFKADGRWRVLVASYTDEPSGLRLACEASEYDAKAIGLGSAIGIADWNDDECKSKAEAVAKLREAAALARSEGR